MNNNRRKGVRFPFLIGKVLTEEDDEEEDDFEGFHSL